MNSIKKQISNLRQTTPRHIQWLLMAVAFVVVIILLSMVINGKNNQAGDEIDAKNGEQLQLFIEPENLDWSETPVGETMEKQIIVTASEPVKVINVRPSSENIQGLNIDENCSTSTVTLNKKSGCIITVKYAPTAAMKPTGAPIYIYWHGAHEGPNMKQDTRVMMVLGAIDNAKKSDSEPVQRPEPKQDDAPAQPSATAQPTGADVIAATDDFSDTNDTNNVDVNDNDESDESTPVRDEIRRDIEMITPADSNLFDATPTKSTKPTKVTKRNKSQVQTYHDDVAEACSDFAIPGYSPSGRQIGWIKPENGTYYFHPFSDKNCDSPTGRYNPDNGIITDIENPGKKIGTDAEHIGYTRMSNGTLPQLNDAPKTRSGRSENIYKHTGTMSKVTIAPEVRNSDFGYNEDDDTILTNTIAHDRSFILRQYKPIPATIVSDIRADPEALKNQTLPVRATVDRNVYADNGRTVVIPAGTLLMGYVTGTLPGPYTAIGRMDIRWYQFVLPNGVEFNFPGDPERDPFSADAQGRTGVPGRGSTDYMEQFVMPMLTAIVPAAVNMIAPIADRFVNQIDLDNNTVVQSGTVRSSELAKNEIITAWNQVAQKLMVDMMDNTTPPFSIAAGTRITVYSPMDLMVTCGQEGSSNKKCAVAPYSTKRRHNPGNSAEPKYEDGSWVGQARSFDMSKWCTEGESGAQTARNDETALKEMAEKGYSYSTVLFYCQTQNYKAINNAKQDALYQSQQQQFQNKYQVNSNAGGLTGISGNEAYNKEVLGLKYDDDTGAIINPFQSLPKEEAPATISCLDGKAPDADGCCTGEVLTTMEDGEIACCPTTGDDCFPPIELE